MTAEEIRRDHRLAKDPEAQIQILAELNQVDAEEIMRILNNKTGKDGIAPRRRKTIDEYKALGKQHGFGKKGRWTCLEKEVLRQMRADGYSCKEIGGALNRPPNSIANMAIYYKYPSKKRKAASDAPTSDTAK